MSNSLQPHGLQQARLPCPSLTHRACSKSYPLSWWSHLTISSSVIPFSSCLQSFPASGSFPMNNWSVWNFVGKVMSLLFNMLSRLIIAFLPKSSPWNFLGQNTGVGSLSLLQGTFPTQGSNSGLPHCKWILYQLSHKGSLSLSLTCLKYICKIDR